MYSLEAIKEKNICLLINRFINKKNKMNYFRMHTWYQAIETNIEGLFTIRFTNSTYKSLKNLYWLRDFVITSTLLYILMNQIGSPLSYTSFDMLGNRKNLKAIMRKSAIRS